MIANNVVASLPSQQTNFRPIVVSPVTISNVPFFIFSFSLRSRCSGFMTVSFPKTLPESILILSFGSMSTFDTNCRGEIYEITIINTGILSEWTSKTKDLSISLGLSSSA